MTDIKKKADRWSYSKVGTFKTCPRLYQLQYLYGIRGGENAFSQYGGMCHSILERYAKGQIDIENILDEYYLGFDTMVTMSFPEMGFMDLNRKYYQDGERFFKSFTGFGDETINVEEKFHFIIKRDDSETDIDFVGIIDRVSKIGNIYIINDYKSKGKFKSKAEKNDYFKQLYLYAIYLKDKFNLADENIQLKMSLFRLQEEFVEYFNSNVAENIKQDFLDNIKIIENTKEFPCNPNKFFCTKLCGVNPIDCEFREESTHEDNIGTSKQGEGVIGL